MVTADEGGMTHVDVAIIGGGSAGSLTAAMLGHAGTSTMFVDTHRVFPSKFQCEKIHGDQPDMLEKTGLASEILAQLTPISETWECRRGFLIGRWRRWGGKPWEYGCAYEDLVAAFRSQIPDGVHFIRGKATHIATSEDRQTIKLSNGETWTARLVVLAIGPNNNLFHDLGITRTEISKCHSVSIGFDVASKRGFKFPALTYFAERVGSSGYCTIFPIKDRMRVNWFLYRDYRDPYVKAARENPLPVILASLPRLKAWLGDAEVAGNICVRPVDLNSSNNYLQPGVVLIGDSFGTSCPATGTGLTKVITDVERLCNRHIPTWLETPGMGVNKLRQFYKDRAKVACDRRSKREAFYQRSLANDPSFTWTARRLLRVVLGRVHGLRARLRQRSKPEKGITNPMPARLRIG